VQCAQLRLIECLPYALCRFHIHSFILHSDVRFMMRIECVSNMVNAHMYILCPLNEHRML
jgi:hypothetical protein